MKQFFLFTLIFFSSPIRATPDWHVIDDFTSNEITELKAWVMHAESGMTALFGPLPYEYRVFFYRRSDPRSPVPWAETEKHTARDVHFHVDTSHSWQAFYADWTAPHELTHLMFPYLGDSGRWFAEGIASYLQYQVMFANHTIDWEEGIARYQERFRHARLQGLDEVSIVELSKKVERLNAYVRLYWGGAAYFMQVDKKLFEEKGLRLTDIIHEYMHCCYQGKGTSVENMMRTFNRISDTEIFTEVYQATVKQKHFPQTSEALNWLSQHPPRLNSKIIVERK